MLKRSQLSGYYPMMEGAALKGPLTIDEILSAAEPVTEEMEVKKEDQETVVIDMTKPATSPELGPPVVEVTRKMREAVYPACSFYNVGSQELLDEHEHTYRESSLEIMDWLPTDSPYNVRSVHKDVGSHYGVLRLEVTAFPLLTVSKLQARELRAICFFCLTFWSVIHDAVTGKGGGE